MSRSAWGEEGSSVDEEPPAMGTDAWIWRFDDVLLLWREIEAEGEMDEGGDPGEGDGGSSSGVPLR